MEKTFLEPPPLDRPLRPGDGAWLLTLGLKESNKKRSRYRRKDVKLQSFLNQNKVEVAAGGQMQGPRKTFLLPYAKGKEPTSHLAPDLSAPRTIEKETPLSPEANTPTPRITSFLQHSTSSSNTLEFTSDPLRQGPAYTLAPASQIPEADPMAPGTTLPLHLRAKGLSSSKASSQNKSLPETLPPAQIALHLASEAHKATCTHDIDIRQKLAEDHNVKVSTPLPALVAYSSSNEEHQIIMPNGARGQSSYSGSRRGQANGHNRGGNNRRGRGGKDSIWIKNSDIPKPDPNRSEIRWDDRKSFCSSIDSMCADSGYGEGAKKKKRVPNGIDSETGFELTDYSGNWAPAPVDWDARPGFRPDQTAWNIELWMNKIDEEMCGKTWAIPMNDVTVEGITFYFAPDPKKQHLLIMGEPAPQYWKPIVIDRQAPLSFWRNIVKSNDPQPVDEDDLKDVMPWWQLHQVKGGYFLQHYEQPLVTGIDPDEDLNERLARENDFGSDQHTQNRKRTEKAKRDAQRDRRLRAQEKARKISESSPTVRRDTFKPGVNLYLRSAKPGDMARVREIYNHYVEFSVCTPETQRRTHNDMLQRYRDVLANKLPFLVACERGGKVSGRRKKNMGEDLVLPDTVVGFAMADDYNDLQGMYRFTAELEVYTDKNYYMKGVAKCLVDKLVALLDPNYIERGGYDIVGEELEGIGPSRVIQNIIVNLPYDKPERLEWMSRWLTNWLEFKQVGHLEGIGNKNGKRYAFIQGTVFDNR